MKKFKHKEQSGYILLGAVVLMAIGALIIAGNLDLTATSAATAHASITRSEEYFRAEQSLGFASSWLRSYSTSMANVFGRGLFYSKFDRTSPSVGLNDNSLFQVPTKIKMQGTMNSVILAKGEGIATAAYPTTVDTVTGISFDPAAVFQNASLGSDLVRVTLVDAVAGDPSKDYGDPDTGNPVPATDFNPIYRIDSMRSTERGGHVFGYLVGSLVFDYGIGFYGKDLLEMRQGCDSYLSNAGSYSAASRRANCMTGSDGIVRIHSSEKIYGSVRTKGSFQTAPPWGGAVCADFTCTKPGQICQGATCSVPGLPAYNAWNVYCPTNKGDQIINGVNVQVTVPAPGAALDKCWNKLRIGTNKSAVLSTTTYAYYIDTIDLANNGGLTLAPDPNTATVNIYTRKIVGNKFNANQVINAGNKPYQLRLHYLGTDSIDVNGNADLSLFIVAPYAQVTVSGNADYYGGIKAKSLLFTGNGKVHYDESGDITTLSDVQFKIRDVVGRYR